MKDARRPLKLVFLNHFVHHWYANTKTSSTTMFQPHSTKVRAITMVSLNATKNTNNLEKIVAVLQHKFKKKKKKKGQASKKGIATHHHIKTHRLTHKNSSNLNKTAVGK